MTHAVVTFCHSGIHCINTYTLIWFNFYFAKCHFNLSVFGYDKVQHFSLISVTFYIWKLLIFTESEMFNIDRNLKLTCVILLSIFLHE